MKTLRYKTAGGKVPFTDWLGSLKDMRGKVRVLKRIERLEGGNFGDCHPCRDGVSELVIDFGPGYRVYFSQVGNMLVLLLCGGDKGSQPADINKAVEYLHDFKDRTK